MTGDSSRQVVDRTGGASASPVSFRVGRDPLAKGEALFSRRTLLGGALGVAATSLLPGVSEIAAETPPARIISRRLQALARSLSGRLILPNDPEYAGRRLTWNRRIVSSPLAIVEAADERDVSIAVRWSMLEGVPLVPRSGGHSYVGASGGRGIVLDLRHLNGTTLDDSTGLVRIGSGATLGSLYRQLHCEHGLSLPSGTCPGVGIAGITLGGGWGWASREYGLTCDRLVHLRAVLADGTIADTSEGLDEDLDWAMRGGGGGAFGIATEFRFEPIPSHARSLATVRYRWSDFESAFLSWQEFLTSNPPWWISPVASITSDAEGGDPIFRVSLSVAASPDVANALAGSLVPTGVTPISRTAVTQAPPSCTTAIGSGASYGKQKSSMPREPLGHAAISIIRQWFDLRRRSEEIPASERGSLLFDGYGGRIGAVGPDATAFAHREAICSMQFSTIWQSDSTPRTVAAHLEWIRGFYDEVRPWLGRGCYVNYPDEDLDDWPFAYWDANLPRLMAIKQSLDPTGFFHGVHTVPRPT